MKVTALIAAFNEEGSIETVVRGTRAQVADVVVVDDGSTDRTAERAERAGAVVLRHAANHGKGVAVRSGLDRVLAGDSTHVLFIDGDGQHDVADIPLLIERARSGAGDFVVAERSFVKQGMPTARFYANTIGSRILSCLIGTQVRDSQSGFRLIRTDLLRAVTLDARRYEIETEILIKLARRGAHIEQVTVVATYGTIQSKMRPVRDVFRICMRAVRYRYLAGE